MTSCPLRLEFGSFDPLAISVQLYHLHLSCPYKKLTDKKCLIADSIAEQKVNIIKSDADYLLFKISFFSFSALVVLYFHFYWVVLLLWYLKSFLHSHQRRNLHFLFSHSSDKYEKLRLEVDRISNYIDRSYRIFWKYVLKTIFQFYGATYMQNCLLSMTAKSQYAILQMPKYSMPFYIKCLFTPLPFYTTAF